MRSLIKHIQLALASLMAVLVAVGGVGGVAAAEKVPEQRADVAVVVRPTQASGTVTYQIVATNGGKGPAQNTVITVPFDASKLRLEDVQFSGGGAWVTDIQPSAFTVQIERLSSGGDTLTINARFVALASLQSGAVLGERLSYRWNDKQGSANGLTNLPILTDGGATFALSGNPASAPARTKRTFATSGIFAPGEFVTMWYTTAAGKAVELEVKGTLLVDAASTDSDENGGAFVIADGNGAVSAQFATDDLAPGSYTMVARGNRTGYVAVASFEVR